MGGRTYKIALVILPAVILAAALAISGGEPAKPETPPSAPAPLGENESGIDKTLSPDVVATVNGKPVLRKEFNDSMMLKFGWQNLRLVADRIAIEDEAKRAGITVSDSEIDAEVEKKVENFIQDYGGREKAEKYLYDNFFYDLDLYRKYARDNCASNLMIQKIAAIRSCSDEKVKQLFEENTGPSAGRWSAPGA